jgi:solute carrier family 13 (sodium-dependent dicarboxylate transporter), member 2/3/5
MRLWTMPGAMQTRSRGGLLAGAARQMRCSPSQLGRKRITIPIEQKNRPACVWNVGTARESGDGFIYGSLEFMAVNYEPVIPTTQLEEQIEKWRARVGLILAPLLLATIGLLPIAAFEGKPEAQRLAAVLSGVIVLWVTEALPLAVTALLGAVLCTVLRVADAKTIFAPFADQLMFLFIGSFILARAIFLHGLDRRFAYGVLSLRWVGAKPSRILFSYGAVTAFISAWISNTATTAMMLAIGLSIVRFLYENQNSGGPKLSRNYATGLILMTSFAASIGGLATPIGTPPNIIGLSMIRNSLHVEISFFEWMLLGVPIVSLLYLVLYGYLNFLCPAEVSELTGSHAMLENNRQKLGAWSWGEVSTCLAFLVTILLWIIPGVVALVAGETSRSYQFLRERCPEGVAALVGAILLFLLPGGSRGASPPAGQPMRRAMTWPEAVEIDWGVVLLYGGGFAFGELSRSTGLAGVLGNVLAAWVPWESNLGILLAATVAGTLVSEATSNTAAANIIVPLAISLAQSVGVDPLAPALGATFGSSLGFMLPVSTPCNAIVYGTGYVPLGRMIRYGILLDLAGIMVIVGMLSLLTPLLGLVR